MVLLWTLHPDVLRYSDVRIAFLLTQRKEEVLLRKHQWRTPFISDLRFDAWTSKAVRLAETLSDATEPISANWTPMRLLVEVETDAFHDSDPSPPADEDICLLNDTLEAMLVEDPVADHQAHAHPHPATPQLVPSAGVPMVDRELLMSDTNPVRLKAEYPAYSLSLSLRNNIQYTARINTSLSLPPIPDAMPTVPPESCAIPGVPGLNKSKPLTFTSAVLNRLHIRHEWLNDECIDFCSEVFQRHFGTSTSRGDSAIFSVFTIAQYLRGYDEALWRTSCLTSKFWQKNLWMIPINREFNHWTLAIVYWKKRRIAYFDSFASKAAWETDAPVTYAICQIHEGSDFVRLACLRSGTSPAPLCHSIRTSACRES